MNLFSKVMKIEALIYHPKLVELSYKVYKVSASLGFAVMPSPKEYYSLESVLKKISKEEKPKDLYNSLVTY